MAEENSITLTFGCACNRVSGSTNVSPSCLPLSLNICHCNICRRQSGLLAASYISLPQNFSNLKIEGITSSYAASENVTRYFCSVCGSNVYLEDHSIKETSLCSGVLEESGNKVYLEYQIFVTDTKDGGMSSWLPNIPGWEGSSQESKPVDCSLAVSSSIRPSAPEPSSELQGHCQCGSIQYKLTRPNEKSSDLHSPLSNLLVPNDTTKSKRLENKDDIKWWLRGNGTKYLAGTCACNSCRNFSGFDIQAWAFIPKVNLFDMRGNPLAFDRIEGLKEYRSSEGVYRYFCGKCGATAFWRCDLRPGLIDVSVGLLDAEEGARAESWLEWWTNKISYEEEAPNGALVKSLKSGLQKWGEKKSNLQV